MSNRSRNAARDLRRMIKWIFLAAILMVVAALAFLAATDALSPHAVVATALGVFFAVLLGSGLFALAFFSDKSGHDETVRGSTQFGPVEPATRTGAADPRIGSRQDGEDPGTPSDLLSERGHLGAHGGSGDPGWKKG